MLVRFYAVAREIAGCGETTVAANSIPELSALLGQRYGERMDRLVAASTLLHDGVRRRSIDDVALTASDTVDLLPPFAGG